MRYLKVLVLTLGFVPVGFIITLLGFYAYAANFLGRQPFYENPDPGNIPSYRFFSRLIDMSGNVWLFSVMPFFIAGIFFVLKKEKLNIPVLCIGIALHILAFALFFSDIFEWYID